jgi:hypothetical protein
MGEENQIENYMGTAFDPASSVDVERDREVRRCVDGSGCDGKNANRGLLLVRRDGIGY